MNEGAGEMSYQIALASSDGTHIDRHFGHSEIFYIAAVAENGSYELIGQRAVDSPCNHGSHDEGAMQAAVTALADCRYVLAEAIGRGAAAQLQVRGITPLETEGLIDDAVPQVIAYDRRSHGIRLKQKENADDKR